MAIKRFTKILAVAAFTGALGIQESSACGDPFDMISLANPHLQVQRGFNSGPVFSSRYSPRLSPEQKEKYRNAGAPAGDETARPAVGKRLAAAQKLIDKTQFSEALDEIAKAETKAQPEPSPYEIYAIAALRASALAGSGNSLGAAHAYEVVLDTKRLPADRQLKMTESVAVTFFLAKDYPRAVNWVRRYAREGGADGEILFLVPKAYYLSGHFQNAAHESSALIAAARAVGQQPSQALLGLWSSSVAQQKNVEPAASQTLVRYSPPS
ncbi:MAG: hypothetical protein ACT4PZ_20490 [Panacagrimonas sp.]